MNADAASIAGQLTQIYSLLQQSQLVEAERHLVSLLRQAPRDPAVHRARAAAAQMAGRLDDAIDGMRTAVELAPNDVVLRMALGQLLASTAQVEGAIDAFRQAATLQPDLVEAWYCLGMTLYGVRRDAEALPAFHRAHAQAPSMPRILHALAETEHALERFADALIHYEKLDAGHTADAMLFLRLSQCRRRTGSPQRALIIVGEGLARFPDEAMLWFELGWVQEDLGDAGQAAAAYAQAHALNPAWPDPVACAIALLGRAAPDALVDTAEAMLAADGIPAQQKAFLHHVLGKRNDSFGAFAAAAGHWQAANRLRRAQDGAFDRAAYVRRIDATIATCDAECLRASRGTALRDERPIFVVGMPRSGTTLVEQILAAHPQAHGCGELDGIASISDAISIASTAPDAGSLRRHAQAYLSLATRNAPEGATRLIDKQPYNFLHIGAIAMLFADARIVWCRRDPRDIALSIYSESFAPSATYATDLDDIAFVIAQQKRLMRHWQAVSPLPILEMQYEAAVTDTESQIRRLTGFAGLPWDARCLHFHDSGRTVQTLSRWQVRQPVHTRSVGRWRNYPQWFGENA